MHEFSENTVAAPQLSAVATHLSDQLESARRIIEERFLDAGAVLSRHFKGLETFISTIDRLLETLNTDIISETSANLETAADKLAGLPESNSARLGNITTLGSACNVLTGHVEDMKVDLAYMRVFTVNIKIVAGGIGDSGGEFSLFAEDIADCVHRVSAELDGITEDTKNLLRSQSIAMTQGSSLNRRMAALIPSLPQSLIHHAGAMRTHYSTIAKAAAEVRERAKDVRKTTSRILVALQIGDSTRQRIEHIQHSLQICQQNAEIQNHAQAEALTGYIYTLAAAQMKATADHFTHDVEEINASISVLAQAARDMLQLNRQAFRSDSTTQGNFLDLLSENLRSALELVSNIETTDTSTAQTGRQAAASAENLNKRILQIQLLKNDVQYMALNTTLKCCQIGDIGQPLSVVAVELRVHAERLEQEAAQCLSVLETLMHASNALSGTENKQTLSQAAQQALKQAEQRLREASEKTGTEISTATELGDTVARALESAAKEKSIQQDIGETLNQVTDKLEKSTMNRQPCTPDMLRILQSTFDTLARDYTMADEREIYRTVKMHLGLADTVQIPSAPEASDVDDLDALLF